MSNPLSHLTDNQVDELIKKYYAGEKISNLLKEYNIDSKKKTVVKYFPSKKIDRLCQYCNVNLYQEYKTRDSYYTPLPRCNECGHVESNNCKCSNCKKELELKEQAEEARKKQELEDFIKNQKPVQYENLEFNDLVYLGALFRAGLTEDLRILNPIYYLDKPYAPTSEFEKEILENLYSKNLIIPLQSGGFITDFHEARYIINIVSNDMNFYEIVNKILNPNYPIDEKKEELVLIWKRIAIEECKKFLNFTVYKLFHINCNTSEKTDAILYDLLNNFSICQVILLIDTSITKSFRWACENNISKFHAVNTIMINTQKYGERAIINGWKINNKFLYNDNEYPQSTLSSFFFDRILKIGFKAITEKPHIDIL